MEITSSAFTHNGSIPTRFSCDGENINPQIEINNVPEGTVSLALICDDPDAPGGTWTHWTAWNIKPEILKISENSVPDGGVEGVTSFGKPGYGGPCPPKGQHRYFFHLYALDTSFDLGPETSVDDLRYAMDGHVIDSAVLMGHYER